MPPLILPPVLLPPVLLPRPFIRSPVVFVGTVMGPRPAALVVVARTLVIGPPLAVVAVHIARDDTTATKAAKGDDPLTRAR